MAEQLKVLTDSQARMAFELMASPLADRGGEKARRAIEFWLDSLVDSPKHISDAAAQLAEKCLHARGVMTLAVIEKAGVVCHRYLDQILAGTPAKYQVQSHLQSAAKVVDGIKV